MNIVWRQINGKYTSSICAYCGRVKIGEVFYDGARPRGTVDLIKSISNMPGIKSNLGYFETEEQAKEKIELAFNHWVKMLNTPLN